MAAKFKIENIVKQIIVPIQGTVKQRIIVDDEDAYIVEWPDADGGIHQRVFKEDEIELIEV